MLMIEATGLGKVYTVKKKKSFFRSEKQKVNAVQGLNLTIGEGEIVGLLGLNGAGKTTTIKMLCTLLNPSEGRITVDGLDAVEDAMRVKSMVNMIAGGERMLYTRLTGVQNLRYFGKLYGLTGEGLESRMNGLLEEVGLTEAAHTPVELYSKGMKQRLQIARGLINDPKYLFLDEPTLGLDAPVAKQLREMVKKLAKNEGKGILLTSHYLEEVEELCDRVYIIEKGSLMLHDTPKNIISSVVKDYYVKLETSLLSPSQQQQIKQGLTGCTVQISETSDGSEMQINAPYDPTALIIRVCVKESVAIQKLEMKRPRLEDAILTLAEAKLA
jgi:ABC-2 type transport system ATP-binding protein